jgi:UDP-3-O-[3-hydroxymyristoyl] N-acetylglucosamine deacetylase
MVPSASPLMTISCQPMPCLTVSRAVRWEGIGIHSGATCAVTVTPSDQPGLVFYTQGTSIPAVADYVTDTTRCTVLEREGASVATVEHLLSALAGLGIWRARIEIEGSELPILDGSAKPFVEGLRESGLTLAGTIEAALIRLAGRIESGSAFREWGPQAETPVADFRLTGDHPLLIGQTASVGLTDPEAYAQEIAPCRTWAPFEQVQALLELNLIQGGSLENALVVYSDHYSSPLRRDNEPARHKLLDLIGDLALVGRPVLGKIAAAGGGHALNVEMARALRAELCEGCPEGA